VSSDTHDLLVVAVAILTCGLVYLVVSEMLAWLPISAFKSLRNILPWPTSLCSGESNSSDRNFYSLSITCVYRELCVYLFATQYRALLTSMHNQSIKAVQAFTLICV
jgi:hypothetical protein